jgi:hypothetical protein
MFVGLLSISLLVLTSQFPITVSELITTLSAAAWSNVQYNTSIAYLNSAAGNDGCTYISIPPNSHNWILILEDFNTCPLSKIAQAQEAGYRMLITYTSGDTYNFNTDAVETTNFPVVILSEEDGTLLLQKLSMFPPGSLYAVLRQTNNNTILQLTIYVDTTVSPSNADESSSKLSGGPIAGIVIGSAVGVLFIAVILLTIIIVLITRRRKKVDDTDTEKILHNEVLPSEDNNNEVLSSQDDNNELQN